MNLFTLVKSKWTFIGLALFALCVLYVLAYSFYIYRSVQAVHVGVFGRAAVELIYEVFSAEERYYAEHGHYADTGELDRSKILEKPVERLFNRANHDVQITVSSDGQDYALRISPNSYLPYGNFYFGSKDRKIHYNEHAPAGINDPTCCAEP